MPVPLMSKDQNLHVVLGTGPLGQAVARALQTRDHRVRMVNRSGTGDVPTGVDLVAADITNPNQARRACSGAAVVYHCMATAYTDWPETLPPLMQGAINGAAAAEARLVYGDNLYMYGPPEGPLTEDLPYAATTRKGQVRAQVAETLMMAHRKGEVAAVIGRGSDFYGPGVTDSKMGDMVFGRIVDGKSARVLGDPDQPHTYTYIDDFGRALVTLGEEDTALGETWHVPSAETVTTRQFVDMIFEEVGEPASISAAPSWVIRAMGWFNPTMREVAEMLYEFEEAFVVDHGKYETAFGTKVTPHRDGIRCTLEWYRRRQSTARAR